MKSQHIHSYPLDILIKINLPEVSALRHTVKIANPLGEDTSIMRTTLIPSMLEILSRNYNNRNEAAKLFECKEYTQQHLTDCQKNFSVLQ